MRVGERVVGALDDRQQREFERQAAALDLGRDVGQVALRAREDPVEVVRVPHEPVAFGRSAVVVLVVQRESEAQLCQQVPGLGRAVSLQRQAVERRDQSKRGRVVADAGRHPAGDLGGGCRQQNSDADGAQRLNSLQ